MNFPIAWTLYLFFMDMNLSLKRYKSAINNLLSILKDTDTLDYFEKNLLNKVLYYFNIYFHDQQQLKCNQWKKPTFSGTNLSSHIYFWDL